MRIKPTVDRKTRQYKTQANTFGLLPGPSGTCPGCTVGEGGCWAKRTGRVTETCYVVKLMQAYSSISGVLAGNTALLKNSSYDEMVEILTNEFQRFLANNRGVRGIAEHLYRLHWSGDIFSADYARALNTAIKNTPEVTFWCYTRSLDFIGEFDADNLIMYISTDPVNFMRGYHAYIDHHENPLPLRIAYMGAALSDLPDDDTLARIGAARHKLNRAFGLTDRDHEVTIKTSQFATCPTDSGKLSFEDACARCRICTTKDRPLSVFFKAR